MINGIDFLRRPAQGETYYERGLIVSIGGGALVWAVSPSRQQGTRVAAWVGPIGPMAFVPGNCVAVRQARDEDAVMNKRDGVIE